MCSKRCVRAWRSVIVAFCVVVPPTILLDAISSTSRARLACRIHGSTFLLLGGKSSLGDGGSERIRRHRARVSRAAQKPWWMFWEPDADEDALFGKNMLPCTTQAGETLLSQLEDGGEDAFLESLQTQLVALRSKWQSTDVAANLDTLQARIAEVERTEEQQQILADLLHIGTIYRLRAEGMELTRGPLHATTTALEGNPMSMLNMSLSTNLRPLPAEVAIEVQDYVHVAVPNGLKADMQLRVGCRSLAPLLMGGALFGYVLCKAAEAAKGASPSVTKQDLTEWNSTGAFVAAAFHVGQLLGLEPESEDPLRQFGSLEQIATEVSTLPSSLESLEKQDPELTAQDKLNMTVRDVRGLLGEMCTMGFVLNLWEAKVMRFVAAPTRS